MSRMNWRMERADSGSQLEEVNQAVDTQQQTAKSHTQPLLIVSTSHFTFATPEVTGKALQAVRTYFLIETML